MSMEGNDAGTSPAALERIRDYFEKRIFHEAVTRREHELLQDVAEVERSISEAQAMLAKNEGRVKAIVDENLLTERDDARQYARRLQGAAAYAVLIFGKILHGRSYQRSDIVEAQNKLADAVRADGSFLCDAFKAQKADDALTMEKPQ